MNNKIYKSLLFFIFTFVLSLQTVFSQQASINALEVVQSKVIEELKSAKAANPAISAEDLVKTANSLLDKEGINYVFAFDENTCRAIGEARKKQKDSKSLNLNAKLSSVAGDKTSLVLPKEQYDAGECGRCFVYLPVWEATEKDFVTFVQNVNVKFYLPANFQLNEIDLVDNNNLNSVVKRWKIPYRAAPLSISDDGKIIYISLPDKEFSDLVLMIYDEGVIQFEAKKEIDADKKATLLKDFPQDAANPNVSYISFEKDGTKQTLKFNAPCGN